MNLNWIVESVSSQIPQTAPDRIALSFDARVRTSYGELEERTRRYARALHELGLRKGDRLGLCCTTTPSIRWCSWRPRAWESSPCG